MFALRRDLPDAPAPAPEPAALAGPAAEDEPLDTFYTSVLFELCAEGRLDPGAPTLVVCGGAYDKACLETVGFTDVTISNLDERLQAAAFAPYAYAFEDVEALSFPDGHFAQVLVHAGLHHCASPHRGLLEMYRVARHAIVVIENKDSALMRLAARCGLSARYEIEAVVANDLAYGGMRNRPVPNFVYRWTEDEVAKTLRAYCPEGPLPLRFFHGLKLPIERLRRHKNPIARMSLIALRPMAALAELTLRRQGNLFGFWAGKPERLWPWLRLNAHGLAEPDRQWIGARFDLPATSRRSAP